MTSSAADPLRTADHPANDEETNRIFLNAREGQILSLSLQSFGEKNFRLRSLDPTAWPRPAHRDAFYNFLAVTAGGIEAELDGEAFDLRAPCLVCIPPGEIHAYRLHPGTAGYFLGVEEFFIPRAFARVFEARRGRPALQVAREAPETSDIAAILAVLEKYMTLTDHYGELSLSLTKSAVMMFALALPPCVGAAGTEAAGREGRLAKEFLALVAQNFRSMKTTAEYAERLGVPSPRLTKAVTAATGMPPGRVIRQSVVQEAKRLLFYTELPVEDIASELGYDDPGHFSRIFSKSEGASPRAFRAALRKT